LAIVRSIATAHHGTVTAEAGAAGGLHLTVALPTLD
jgi:signal transduction histidine kinase